MSGPVVTKRAATSLRPEKGRAPRHSALGRVRARRRLAARLLGRSGDGHGVAIVFDELVGRIRAVALGVDDPPGVCGRLGCGDLLLLLAFRLALALFLELALAVDLLHGRALRRRHPVRPLVGSNDHPTCDSGRWCAQRRFQAPITSCSICSGSTARTGSGSRAVPCVRSPWSAIRRYRRQSSGLTSSDASITAPTIIRTTP